MLSLSSCSNTVKTLTSRFYYFDTLETVTIYDGKQEDMDYVEQIIKTIHEESDNYSTENALYRINQSSEVVTISETLYNLFYHSYEMKNFSNDYFNPLVGRLSKKWKAALKEGKILTQAEIEEELAKINSTELYLYSDNNKIAVSKVGEAEFDFGGIAKGYTLDVIKEYLDQNRISSYLIDCGSSSILLGEKPTGKGYFNVGLNIPGVNNAYVQLKNCFIGASGTSEQGVLIDSVMYSHIVNPYNGSVFNEHDYVFVSGNNGAMCDAFATAFMNMNFDDIKIYSELYDLETIIYNGSRLLYKTDNIEIKYHS